MTRPTHYCSFCGRAESDCPGGLVKPRADPQVAICVYCTRVALRAFGEVPDASLDNVLALPRRFVPADGGGAVTLPGYWMHETSGALRPAVEAYLNHQDMTTEQIAVMRAYLRQWIMAPRWDQNPFASLSSHRWLAQLRARIDELTSRDAITRWIDAATEGGLDPL